MNLRYAVPGLLLLLAAALPPAYASDPAMSYVEYQRQVLRGEREVAVRANLELTAKEAEAFWPLYREYHAERDKLADRSYRLIRDYAAAYNSGRVTEAQAQQWTRDSAGLEVARARLKERYLEKFAQLLPGKKFARYYQIETKLDNQINAKLSSEIPLVE